MDLPGINLALEPDLGVQFAGNIQHRPTLERDPPDRSSAWGSAKDSTDSPVYWRHEANRVRLRLSFPDRSIMLSSEAAGSRKSEAPICARA